MWEFLTARHAPDGEMEWEQIEECCRELIRRPLQRPQIWGANLGRVCAKCRFHSVDPALLLRAMSFVVTNGGEQVEDGGGRTP